MSSRFKHTGLGKFVRRFTSRRNEPAERGRWSLTEHRPRMSCVAWCAQSAGILDSRIYKVWNKAVSAISLSRSKILLGALALLSCSACAKIDVVDSKRAASPDAKWAATTEHLEGGGLNGVYHEVHLHPHNEGARAHGDRDDSVVFYIKADQRSYLRPSVEWRDARTLLVKYANVHAPGKMTSTFGDVKIEYQAVEPPLGCTESIL